MGYRKQLNGMLHRNELILSKSRLFFISLKRVDITAESHGCIFLISFSCYLHNTSMVAVFLILEIYLGPRHASMAEFFFAKIVNF